MWILSGEDILSKIQITTSIALQNRFMVRIIFLGILNVLSIVCYTQGQANAIDVNFILKSLSTGIDSKNELHYQCQMRFKGFGSDTFEVRDFSIAYKRSKINELYGYDFKVEELIDGTDTLTHMVLDSGLYVCFNPTRQISRFPLPESIDIGSYIEYLRYSLVLKELLRSFLVMDTHDVALTDSPDQYLLTVRINAMEQREFFLDKRTFLPSLYRSTISDLSFGFDQITEIQFKFDQEYDQLRQAVFSIEDYLKRDYHLLLAGTDSSSQGVDQETVVPVLKELIWEYPFIDASGDAVRISEHDGGYILLDFWFASCLPCLRALPELDHLAKTYSHSGLTVLGINCLDKAIGENLEEQIRDKNISMPMLFGPRTLLEKLGISSFPSYYLISPDQSVIGINGGIEEVKSIVGAIFERK